MHKDLDPNKLAAMKFPSDLTLGESRAFIQNTTLKDLVVGKTLRVRFITIPDETELPDDMTMREFRALVKINKAKITIDDGSGGLRVPEKV